MLRTKHELTRTETNYDRGEIPAPYSFARIFRLPPYLLTNYRIMNG